MLVDSSVRANIQKNTLCMCELYSNIYKKNSNDIGVDPKLHFIPPSSYGGTPPYLKKREEFDTSIKTTQQM